MMTPHHVQNTAVKPSWTQLGREVLCAIFGHQFHVPFGGGYPGMSQSHCYRCGIDHRGYVNHQPGRPHFVVPVGYSERQRKRLKK